jgi:multidrug resistance efflux pump
MPSSAWHAASWARESAAGKTSPKRSRRRTQEGDRKARLEGLRRDITRLTGEMATAAATIERRHIRAPTSGQLGEAAVLQVGVIVREGDILGAVLPFGALRVVALFPHQWRSAVSVLASWPSCASRAFPGPSMEASQSAMAG